MVAPVPPAEAGGKHWSAEADRAGAIKVRCKHPCPADPSGAIEAPSKHHAPGHLHRPASAGQRLPPVSTGGRRSPPNCSIFPLLLKPASAGLVRGRDWIQWITSAKQAQTRVGSAALATCSPEARGAHAGSIACHLCLRSIQLGAVGANGQGRAEPSGHLSRLRCRPAPSVQSHARWHDKVHPMPPGTRTDEQGLMDSPARTH
jgi:hypothetical protein